ncbi:MAG: M20/M25/M40 family metallo-hydrolase [Bacteroidales bacterium]|nr:M20/M25/M40 family metallo-hydrolase [Bacteroidales bacterium]
MQRMRHCVFFAFLYMDIDFFHRILSVDSTSGKEAALADILAAELAGPGRKVETYDVGDGTKNILVSWGIPKVIFCTHLDTVPPYISPVMDGEVIRGRGSCDAKGQIFAMYEACKVLESRGFADFGLLLLAGEETGSYGAKAFNSVMSGAASDVWVIVGEPTDNCMASAAKGTKSFEVTFTGRSCHSGYPENGHSAIIHFNDFLNALRSIVFPEDEVLGATTWNVGRLVSDNPQNILSDSLTCRVYFRTTFESDEMVCNVMKNIAGPEAKLRFGRRQVQDGSDIVAKDVALWQKSMSVKAFGGDSPSRFEVLDGFPSKPVAFGSDAPQLSCFGHKILCGPGSIHVAHRPEEHILLKDIEHAINNYIRIYTDIISRQ